MNFRTLVKALLILLIPIVVTAGNVLLNDSFERADSLDINRALPLGQEGIIQNTQWLNFQKAFSSASSESKISRNQLVMAFSHGEGASVPDHNFCDIAVTKAGGFKVTLDCYELDTRKTLPADKYYGFGVGISKEERDSWTTLFLDPGNFRGRASGTGSADFWIGFSKEPALQIRSNGSILESIPVNRQNGVIEATFTLKAGFAKGDMVEVALKINDAPIDIDTTTDATTRIFKWQDNSANYIALEARATGHATFADFKVELLRDIAVTASMIGQPAAPKAPAVTTTRPTTTQRPRTTTTARPKSNVRKRTTTTTTTKPKPSVPETKVATTEPVAPENAETEKASIPFNPLSFLGLIPVVLVLLLRQTYE